jgi:hypothetical protein
MGWALHLRRYMEDTPRRFASDEMERCRRAISRFMRWPSMANLVTKSREIIKTKTWKDNREVHIYATMRSGRWCLESLLM